MLYGDRSSMVLPPSECFWKAPTTASLPFRPLQVAMYGTLSSSTAAWGFLLVFCSKMHRCLGKGM